MFSKEKLPSSEDFATAKAAFSNCEQPEYRTGERLSRFAYLDSANAAADEAVFYRLPGNLIPCNPDILRWDFDIPLWHASLCQRVI